MIKIIEGMEPDEVMRAHRVEGKRVASLCKENYGGQWVERDNPIWDWRLIEYAIIDDTQPELTAEWWRRFDWEFLNQYEGLNVGIDGKAEMVCNVSFVDYAPDELRPSPLYPWQGGKCPVPGECEVVVRIATLGILNSLEFTEEQGAARGFDFTKTKYVAFRLTGNICKLRSHSLSVWGFNRDIGGVNLEWKLWK